MLKKIFQPKDLSTLKEKIRSNSEFDIWDISLITDLVKILNGRTEFSNKEDISECVSAYDTINKHKIISIN